MIESFPLIHKILSAHDALGRLIAESGRQAALTVELREADDATLFNGHPPTTPDSAALIRAGLYYFLDELDEAHALVKDISGDLASYWHAMIHRREPDFENARYWYSRAGTLPTFSEMHHRIARYSADAAKQADWDPYMFTGMCEHHRFGDDSLEADLIKMQRDEFNIVFEYTRTKG